MLPEELPILRYRDGIDTPTHLEDVKLLQQSLGIPPNEIDGQFGRYTELLVKQFQASSGLVADGVVGMNTWSALLKQPVKSSKAPPETTPIVIISHRQFNLDRIIGSIPFPDIRAAARISVPLILAECNTSQVSSLAQIAYILATAEHESHLGNWMEEFASGWEYEGWSDLGNTEPGDGPRFKGRGFVQLTGRANYTAWSNRLNLDLIAHPEQAAQPDIAAKILVQGMRDGSFTGVSLTDYLGDDFYNARRIINGTDRAQRIAAIAQEYLNVL